MLTVSSTKFCITNLSPFLPILTNQVPNNLKYGGKAKFEVLYDKLNVHSICIVLISSSKHKTPLLLLLLLLLLIIIIIIIIIMLTITNNEKNNGISSSSI